MPSKVKSKFSVLPKTNMSALVREDTLEGKEYYVVPTVMMVEGVHNDLYYPAEELAKVPESWNHKPVVVNHPEIDGKPISACSKEELELYKIGLILNTTFEDKKLKSEVWIDKEKVNQVDARIMQALAGNQMLEVSIGLFTEDEMIKGNWGNEEYNAVTHNYKPDHLAILPDNLGACSIQDGAGMPRINKANTSEQLWKFISKYVPGNIFALKDNEISLQDTISGIREALREKLKPSSNEWIYPIDVFDNYVIYEYETNDGTNLFKRSYKIDDAGNVELGEDVFEVKKVISYDLVMNKEKRMDKEKIINELIANGSFKEDDRVFLNELKDNQLESVANAVKKNEEQKDGEVKENDEEKNENEEEVNPAPVPNKKLTLNQYLETLPVEHREVVQSGLKMHREKKNTIIASLVANSRCNFTQEQLQVKGVEELEMLAQLAHQEVDYSASGDALTVNGVEAYVMPSMDDEK